MKLGILGSTRGTNMLALIEAIKTNTLAASIEIVISNKKEAQILKRAEANNLSHLFIDPQGKTREEYDESVSNALRLKKIDLIVLIGYMRILSGKFVNAWQNKIINVHPSLLPSFSGLMDLDVHRAVLESGAQETGCTVHYVTEEVDAGPILLQKKCFVMREDTPEQLKARVQDLEGLALIDAISELRTLL